MSTKGLWWKIKDVFEKPPLNEVVEIKGWVRSVRKSKKFSFIVVNDGSCQDSLQIIADNDLPGYEELSTMLTGSSVSIKGKIVESGGKGQNVEMQATEGKIISAADDTYPLQKKALSLEFLREQAHLRVRTNTFGAIFRVRHALAFATHKFFNDKNFYYMNSPIITGTDAEGAGEMFNVTTFDLGSIPKEGEKVAFDDDYFGKHTFLTVSGQLEAETHALGLGAVYTFGPTFRSENSNTSRHLAEFWMIEPEVAFYDLDDVASLATEYIQYLIQYALENCPKEMEFLLKKRPDAPGEEYLKMLEGVRDSEFVKITYTEAIDILSDSGKKFEYPAAWGGELQTEHERFLTEDHFKKPVIVTDYPKSCKAFYMKQGEDGKTVRAMDILVPGIGEIVGGSQREDSYEKLMARVKELGMKEESLWWYLELRKFGSVPHSGFGLGFERAIQYITGIRNIRDVIPFPRTPKNAEF